MKERQQLTAGGEPSLLSNFVKKAYETTSVLVTGGDETVSEVVHILASA